RTDAGDLVEAGDRERLHPPCPVRADGEAMRLVAKPLDEIENGVAWRQPEGRPALHMEALTAGLAVGALGDADERHPAHPEIGEDGACGIELADPPIDEHEVGPRTCGAVALAPLPFPARAFLHEPREAAGEHLAHH